MADKKGGLLQRVKDAANYIWNSETLTYTAMLASGPGYYVQGKEINWNVNSIQDGYFDNDVIYQSLRVYLRKIRVPSLLLYRQKDEKSYHQYKSFQEDLGTAQSFLNAIKYRKKGLDEVTSHSLLDLLRNPNDYQTQSMLFESLFGYYKLTGDGYLYGAGATDLGVNKGKFKELHVLESQNCTPVYSDNWKSPIHHYEYTIDGVTIPIPKENICHLRDWNPNTKIKGLSAAVPGRKVIKADSKNKTAQVRAFDNGGKGYMISSDSDIEDFQWTQEQAELVDRKIAQKLKGEHNYGNIFSVTRPAKVQAIGDSVADQRLIEAARANISRQSNLFGVDSVLIGDKEQATDNFVKSARKSLITDTVVPDLNSAEESLNAFFRAFGDDLILDYDTSIFAELQPDLELLVNVYGKPSVSENERRALFNYDNLADDKLGNAILVQSGMETLDSIVNAPTDTTTIDNQVDEALKYGDYR